MLDARGGVVPRDDGGLRAPRRPREGDEALGLGDVDGLPVDPRREPDDDARPVAERHGVDGRLHRRERLPVPLPRRRHLQHPPALLRHGESNARARARDRPAFLPGLASPRLAPRARSVSRVGSARVDCLPGRNRRGGAVGLKYPGRSTRRPSWAGSLFSLSSSRACFPVGSGCRPSSAKLAAVSFRVGFVWKVG